METFLESILLRTIQKKRSVISLNILAGGPVTIADQYDTIGNDLWLYQNTELLELNTAKFVGKPLSNDPSNSNSQIWRGQLSNGDWIIGFLIEKIRHKYVLWIFSIS